MHHSVRLQDRGVWLEISEKQNAFSGHAPPGKASGFEVHQRCCQRWAGGYVHPGFMISLPTGSLALPSPNG